MEIVKCVHYSDKNYDELAKVICHSNWFYLHGEIEEWCSNHFGGISDKCSIINPTELPHRYVTADRTYLLCELEGEYEVQLHDCPHKLVGFFYTKKSRIKINRHPEAVDWSELRGLIVKADNAEDVAFAKKKMAERAEII